MFGNCENSDALLDTGVAIVTVEAQSRYSWLLP